MTKVKWKSFQKHFCHLDLRKIATVTIKLWYLFTLLFIYLHLFSQTIYKIIPIILQWQCIHKYLLYIFFSYITFDWVSVVIYMYNVWPSAGRVDCIRTSQTTILTTLMKKCLKYDWHPENCGESLKFRSGFQDDVRSIKSRIIIVASCTTVIPILTKLDKKIEKSLTTNSIQ